MKTNVMVTLNQIKEASPSCESWETLLKGLNKSKSDNEPFDVGIILETNDLEDLCWVLDKVLGMEKELRLFAYWNSCQSYKCIPDAEKEEFKKVVNTVNLYAYGKADNSALASASASASARAWALAWALDSASARARALAWASALASAWASAWDSALALALASAWASDSAWASALASALASASARALDSDYKKAGKKLLKILRGELPAMYKGKNHY